MNESTELQEAREQIERRAREQEEAKHYYDKYDIMLRYDVCEANAIAIIRGIRHYNGGGRLPKGKILPSELDAWENPNPAERKELPPLIN